ncbi:unnamed protein product [Rhizophagus irregularis]|nr:unnamed protein product [Rhizophagus irregularis]
MITFCLLNEGKEVLKPDHQYCICLYVGREKYEDLAKVGQLFQNQLFDLKNNGIIDQDATSQWDMNRTWNNTVNTKCERKSPLFPAINQENYIPDELHLLLQKKNHNQVRLFFGVRQKKGGMMGYNFVIAAFISLHVKSLFLEENFNGKVDIHYIHEQKCSHSALLQNSIKHVE